MVAALPFPVQLLIFCIQTLWSMIQVALDMENLTKEAKELEEREHQMAQLKATFSAFDRLMLFVLLAIQHVHLQSEP